MARARTTVFVLAFFLSRLVFSLQVSPNSPCAAVCVDRENLDLADPNSSNTRPSDIPCKDLEYAGSPGAIKWKTCMSCLEKSGFYQGSDSDQGWFLYNLRYKFNYCIFGYPNNTRIGSNPCQTSTACGALKTALLDGDMDPRGSADYGYCTADNGAMTGQFYAKCLSCITGFTDQKYVTNGLVALEAGCLQRPTPGKVVALSATVFSSEQIAVADSGALDPSAPATDKSGSNTTPTTTIVVIAISAIIALAAVVAIVFVCMRKRRNRLARSRGHRPKSSLSFRCQTHLSPMSPRFFSGPAAGDGPSSHYCIMDDGVSGQQPRHITSSPRSPTMPAWPRASSVVGSSLSPVATEKRDVVFGDREPLSAVSDKENLFLSEKQRLHQLTTTALPTAPQTVHASPVVARSSPVSAATPTSATQLLSGRLSSTTFAPYVPSDYAGIGRQQLSHQSPVSPIVSRQHQHQPGASPHQQWGWAVSPGITTTSVAAPALGVATSPPPPSKSPRVSVPDGAGGPPKKAMRESGSPVETVAIQVSFPGPPKR